MGRWIVAGLCVAAPLLTPSCGDGANEPDSSDYEITPVTMDERTTCYVLQNDGGGPRGISCVVDR